MVRYSLVWGWCGVCYDVVRYGSWDGALWYNYIRRGMVGCGPICYGMVYNICCGMVWYGMVWYGMVWYGMVWYGMVW